MVAAPTATLAIDIETFSSVDLGKSGVHAYARSPDFRVLLFAYAWDDEPVMITDLESGEELPDDVRSALTDPRILKTAFNAAFERTCLAAWLGEPMPPEQWECTMVRALEAGLPGSLMMAGIALDLPADHLKDARGKELIRYFSCPCEPDLATGGGYRHLPQYAPEWWSIFKEYCKRDVDSERAIREKLPPIGESEQKLWEVDQRINDRGVRLDMPLVLGAIRINTTLRRELLDEAAELTGLENPNSRQQVLGWLNHMNGTQFKSLKRENAEAIVASCKTPQTKHMLEIWQETSKTSITKYEAMVRAVCPDGRARGLTQFYGASTGRWTGRRIQLQNLRRNNLPDLDLARTVVRLGDASLLCGLYDSPADVLSQLLRTALIPAEGHRFIVCDFSAIEARVLAWLAEERWRLEVFEGTGKIYEASASRMFNVPIERIVHGNPEYALRQKGKQAELACIAEGQLVLTNCGLVPIENVTTDHMLWDGKYWVNHDGVICKGTREVIEYDGLIATPDHLVWIEGTSREVQFGVAAACGASLVQTGDGGKAVRLGENHQPREAVGQEVAHVLRANTVRGVRDCAVAEPGQLAELKIKGMPGVLTTTTDPEVAGQTPYSRKTEVRESEGSRLSQLWCARDSVRFPERNSCRPLSDRYIRHAGAKQGNRSDRHERRLCSGEPSVHYPEGEYGKPPEYGVERVRSTVLALCKNSGDPETCIGDDTGADHPRCGARCGRAPQKLARHKGAARVYDIRNAGPHHRFTVSGRLVHNCGYQGGVGALIQMGALKMGLAEEELPQIVAQWREANPHITAFWAEIESTVQRMLKAPSGTSVKLQDGKLTLTMHRPHLRLELPSGRALNYRNIRLERNEKTKRQQICCDNPHGGVSYLYGGRLTENIVQSIARDCLGAAMLALSTEGCRIVFHVHDEVIIEEPIGGRTPDDVREIMSRQLPWAIGLPLNADAYACDYYRKD